MSEPTTTPDAPAAEGTDKDAQDVSSLPEWAQGLIRSTRAEAAQYRTQVRELEPYKAKVSEIEESSKTEAQKATERAEAAERRASELERQNTAARLAAEYGVPVEVIHGADEAAMRAVAERVQSWAGQRTPATPPARSLRSGASAGDNGESGKGRAAAALRQLRQG